MFQIERNSFFIVALTAPFDLLLQEVKFIQRLLPTCTVLRQCGFKFRVFGAGDIQLFPIIEPIDGVDLVPLQSMWQVGFANRQEFVHRGQGDIGRHTFELGGAAAGEIELFNRDLRSHWASLRFFARLKP